MIQLLFFSYLRDEIGQETIRIETNQMTIQDIKSYLSKHYQLTSLDSIMFAVNEEYATDTTIVNAGDKVALIPPVSGG
jgi:sulfur-carrier protein